MESKGKICIFCFLGELSLECFSLKIKPCFLLVHAIYSLWSLPEVLVYPPPLSLLQTCTDLSLLTSAKSYYRACMYFLLVEKQVWHSRIDLGCDKRVGVFAKHNTDWVSDLAENRNVTQWRRRRPLMRRRFGLQTAERCFMKNFGTSYQKLFQKTNLDLIRLIHDMI